MRHLRSPLRSVLLLQLRASGVLRSHLRPILALVTAVGLTLLAYGVLLHEIGPRPPGCALQCAPRPPISQLGSRV